jgi:hypothetical protein
LALISTFDHVQREVCEHVVVLALHVSGDRVAGNVRRRVVVDQQIVSNCVVIYLNSGSVVIHYEIPANRVTAATLRTCSPNIDRAGVALHLQIALDLDAADRTLRQTRSELLDLQIAANPCAGAESEDARLGNENVAADPRCWAENEAAAVHGEIAIQRTAELEASAVHSYVPLDLAIVRKRAVLTSGHGHIAVERTIETAVAASPRSKGMCDLLAKPEKIDLPAASQTRISVCKDRRVAASPRRTQASLCLGVSPPDRKRWIAIPNRQDLVELWPEVGDGMTG